MSLILPISSSMQSVSVVETDPGDPVNNTSSDNTQIIAILGDSIAAGRGDVAGPTPILGTVKELLHPSSIVDITDQDVDTAVVGSPWPKLGIDYNALTGKNVLFVARGFGGSEFSPNGDTNNWSSSGARYNVLKTATNTALSLKDVTHLRAIIMILGVNDSRSSVPLATVEADITSLFDRLQMDFPGSPIYIVQVGRHQTAIDDSRLIAIRGYLVDEAAARDKVYIAASLRDFAVNNPEYYDDDDLHLNQDGNNTLGTLLATFISNNI